MVGIDEVFAVKGLAKIISACSWLLLRDSWQ
jgi:hypothetical protein